MLLLLLLLLQMIYEGISFLPLSLRDRQAKAAADAHKAAATPPALGEGRGVRGGGERADLTLSLVGFLCWGVGGGGSGKRLQN
jgi:hypothetical protein